jgi:multiple sugar transport system substrate-binding protein
LVVGAAGTAALFLVMTAHDPAEHLVFATWGTPGEIESFQKLIDHYNATRNPAHTVILSHVDQVSYTEHLLVQAAAYSMPDVIHLDQKDIPLFAERGLLHDLTPLIEADTGFSLEAFLPGLLPGGTVSGRFYGIPHNFSTFVLYYNRDHFDAESLSYPDSTWTWEVFLEAARHLTKTDNGETIRYGCMVYTIPFVMMQQFGGTILNERMDSCVIASPEAAAALRFALDLASRYGVTWSVLSQNLNWDDMFAGGRCSMIANGRWAAAPYLRSLPEGALGVAALPHGVLRRGASVNHLITVSSQSAKVQEAWEFITFLSSEPAQKILNDHGANIPALRSVVYSDAFLHHPSTPLLDNRVFLEELQHSVVWPVVQGPYLTGHTMLTELELAMRKIQLGQASPIQALTVMQENLNRTIARQRRVPEAASFAGSVPFYLCCASLVLAGYIWFRTRRRHSHGRT